MYAGYRFESYATTKPDAGVDATSAKLRDTSTEQSAMPVSGLLDATTSATVDAGDAARETNVTADDKPVNLNEEYCSVVTTKMGPFRMLLAGEVDCKCPRRGHYMELKTTGVIQHEGQQRSFKRYVLI